VSRSAKRYRPTFVQVDLDAVRHNVRTVKPSGSELMAVVKADAYGHGAAPVARAALEAGATWIGVALVEEGIELRDAGIEAPILVLSEFPSGSEADALAARLTPSVYTTDGLDRLAAATRGAEDPPGVHVKIDTGMHRVGLYPPEDASEFTALVAAAGFRLEGLWTHFASAEADDEGTKKQLRWLTAAADGLRARGTRPRYLHAANSAGTLRFPEARLDLVRVGAAIYGLDPGDGLAAAAGLRPALRWVSAVTLVRRLPAGERLSYGWTYELGRDANVATVPVGYEDGYPRALSSRAEVLIRGKRYRVSGTITMDQLMIDCGNDDVRVGDEVVLIGDQGSERIAAEEVGAHMGTIGYEVVTAISDRVPRDHRGADRTAEAAS
jgi:alanine racemase